MKKLFLIFYLFIFPISLTAGDIYTYKEKDGTIHIYDKLNGPNIKTKDLQEINEIQSNKTESQSKNSEPIKVFGPRPVSKQTDRDLCFSDSGYKSKIDALNLLILNAEEKIETLNSLNLSTQEKIEFQNSLILSEEKKIDTRNSLFLIPEEKVKKINDPQFDKVREGERKELDKYRQELSKYQKKYSDTQEEIKRRNMDCSQD